MRAVIIDRPDYTHKGDSFTLTFSGRVIRIKSATPGGTFTAGILLTEEEAEEILEELDDTFPQPDPGCRAFDPYGERCLSEPGHLGPHLFPVQLFPHPIC